MKKSLWSILLVMTFILSGCSAADKEVVVPHEIEEEKEPEQEEMDEQEVTQTRETASHLVSIFEENEDESYRVLNTNEEEYLLTLDEDFPEEERELLTIGAVVNIKAWEVEAEQTEECRILCAVSASAADETLEAAKLEKAAFEKINGFAVDDSICATMYAKQTVNIRKGPSTDYDKLGALKFGEEVTVTGMADTGWYRITYEEEDGYVSNNYLATVEPTVAASSSKGSGTAGNSLAAASMNDSATALGLPYSEAEIDAVMNSGDLQHAWEMNQANLDALNGKGTGGTSSGNSGNTSNPQPAEKSMSTSSEFVNYLNSKREAAGLAKLEWSDSLAQTAKERSGEIVDDFSHQGSRNCSGEIITQTSSGDVSSWYSNFANSPGHNAHMMDEGLYTKVGAGVCQAGNRYYVVVLFDYK